jgi:hypothetical protein
MIAPRYGVALMAMMLGGTPALADENNDLNLIPEGAREPAAPSAEPPPTADTRQRIYLEDAFTLSSLRSPLVPFPPPSPPDWQERLFLDLRKDWTLADHLSFSLSDRVNLRAENDLPTIGHETVINDFREGFVSWEPLDRTYLDLGRINVKSGAATGFNPTDFFKTRAVVEPLSADPAVLREDRLGTLMLRTQHIWQGGAVMAAFAPALYQPTPVYTNTDLRSFDPSFDRTNAHDRLLLKGSVDIVDDVSPELLLYREGNRTTLGANITEAVGQSVVVYAEWAGGDRSSLIDDALSYGRQTGTIPVNAPSALPVDPHLHFQNALSIGFSYTTESKVTFNVEYHYDEAAFSQTDWNNWFRVGRGTGSASPIAAELWFFRAFALEQQEPISEHSTFLRVDWVDAFIPKLEIIGFINTDLYDGSSLVQLGADYYISSAWTVGALADVDLGTKHSDFGSLPGAASFLVKLARYF